MGRHAIIIIRNEEGKYLQYMDEKWNSYLFLNCKLEEDTRPDFIIDEVCERLILENEEIECSYIMDKIHTKFSQKDKRDKEYHHFFYTVEIEDMPEFMKEDTFEIDDITYKWFSMEELENDERIQETNSDIIEFVKEIEE